MRQAFELLSAIYGVVANSVLQFFSPTITITADLPDIVELDSNGLVTCATTADRVVMLNRRPIAAFTNVRAIEVQHFKTGGGRGGREWWTLRLQILGRPPTLLGKSQDALAISTAAARLSTIIDCPVTSLSQTGLQTTRIET